MTEKIQQQQHDVEDDSTASFVGISSWSYVQFIDSYCSRIHGEEIDSRKLSYHFNFNPI